MRLNEPRIVFASVLTVSVFANWYTFDQQVPLREDRDQHALKKVILSNDDAFDFIQHVLHQRAGVAA